MTDTDLRSQAVGIAAQMAQGRDPSEIMALAKQIYQFVSGRGETGGTTVRAVAHRTVVPLSAAREDTSA